MKTAEEFAWDIINEYDSVLATMGVAESKTTTLEIIQMVAIGIEKGRKQGLEEAAKRANLRETPYVREDLIRAYKLAIIDVRRAILENWVAADILRISND